MGRPTKYSDTKGTAIIQHLRAGGTRKAAAEAAGVSYNTFLSWFKKGSEAQSGALHEFYETVEQAEAEAEMRNVAIIQQAAQGYEAGHRARTVKDIVRMKRTRLPDGTVTEEPVTLKVTIEHEHTERERDWKASESWLKRRRRADWGDRLDQELTGLEGGPVTIKILNGVAMKDLDP